MNNATENIFKSKPNVWPNKEDLLLCYFVNDEKRKRALYLALVRSQFEHCSPIWRPVSKFMIQKLESLQKRCIKWILSKENISYNSPFTYIQKCYQVNLLPLSKRFDLNDLTLFHKIVHKLIPLDLPYYLSFYSGNSRLRSCHLDRFSIVSAIHPNNNVASWTSNHNKSPLMKSFFYRTYFKWNDLPFIIRELSDPLKFKTELIKYFWNFILDYSSSSDEEDLIDTG